MSLPNISNVLQNIRQHSRSLGTSLVLLLLISAGLFFYWTLTKPVTLTILVQALEAQRWRPLIKQFEKKHPEIDIEMVEGSDATDAVEEVYAQSFEQEANWLGKLHTPVFGRREQQHYDLVYMDIIWVARFAEEKWLMPLTDEVKDLKLNEFLPRELEVGWYTTKRGKKELYRLPFHSDVGVLYYRKDLLNDKELKPPTTFDELKSISKDVRKETGKWGYLWQGQEYEGLVAMFIEVLYGYGGFWIDPNQVVGLDQPEAIEAVKFLRSTIDQGISPKSVSTSQEDATSILFQNGEAVFLRNWPNVRSFATVDSPIRGKVGIVPMVHAQGQESKACQGGWGLGISKFTKHPKEALAAIKFFTSADSQRKYALSAGSMPSRRSLFNDPLLVERYSYYPKLLEILEQKTVLRPSVPEYHKVSKILQEHLYKALTQENISDKEIEKIMAQAADKTYKCLRGNPCPVPSR